MINAQTTQVRVSRYCAAAFVIRKSNGNPLRKVCVHRIGLSEINPAAVSWLKDRKRIKMSIETIVIIILLIVLFGGGGGYWYSRRR
jgi:hypothetical protein